MNMRIQGSGRDDLALARDGIGGGSHYHGGMDSVHDVGVTGFANTGDPSVFDPDVGLDDAGIIHDEGIGDDGIQAVGIGSATRLAHTLAEGLPSAEFAFVTVDGVVMLDPDPQVGRGEANPVSGGRSKHDRIRFAVHGVWLDGSGVVLAVGRMSKAGLDQSIRDVPEPREIDSARRERMTTADHSITSDLDQGDGLGGAGLKPNRGASGNIQAIAVGLLSVEVQLRVDLDQMIVGAHLANALGIRPSMQVASSSTNRGSNSPESVGLLGW